MSLGVFSSLIIQSLLYSQDNISWPIEFIDQTIASTALTSGYDNDDIMPEYRSDEYAVDEEMMEEVQGTIEDAEL